MNIESMVEELRYRGSRLWYRAVLLPIDAICGWFRLTFNPSSLEVCCRCGKIAQWWYMPRTTSFDRAYCDDCVPRGCSCNLIEYPQGTIVQDDGQIVCDVPADAEEHKDERGRLLPCVEFDFNRWGWPRRAASG